MNAVIGLVITILWILIGIRLNRCSLQPTRTFCVMFIATITASSSKGCIPSSSLVLQLMITFNGVHMLTLFVQKCPVAYVFWRFWSLLLCRPMACCIFTCQLLFYLILFFSILFTSFAIHSRDCSVDPRRAIVDTRRHPPVSLYNNNNNNNLFFLLYG